MGIASGNPTWQDHPDTTTPITAARLNNIENALDGAHEAYDIGDVVTHNGSTWVSTAAANVWEPGVYGWSVQ